MIIRTNHRLLYSLRELETMYGFDRNNLPAAMEVIDDETVAIYLTDEQYKERQGELFPRDPLTGAFCVWDSDYEKIGDLF